MIRGATVADAPEIAEVNASAWQWAYGGILPPKILQREIDPLARAVQTMRMIAQGDLFLVAERSGTVVAYALERRPPELRGLDAEIGSLYVHPDHARQGLGGALVGELARRLWTRGARSLGVNTLADNAIGRRFYERLGGTACPSRAWRGFPCVWYTWDAAAMARLIPSGP